MIISVDTQPQVETIWLDFTRHSKCVGSVLKILDLKASVTWERKSLSWFRSWNSSAEVSRIVLSVCTMVEANFRSSSLSKMSAIEWNMFSACRRRHSCLLGSRRNLLMSFERFVVYSDLQEFLLELLHFTWVWGTSLHEKELGQFYLIMKAPLTSRSFRSKLKRLSKLIMNL